MIAPLGTIAKESIWVDDICLQSTHATCGPASLATILKKLGVEATEAEIAREAYTYAGGTEAWYLARSARKRGCTVQFQISKGLDPTIDTPAIAGVKLGEIGHFIVMAGQESGKYTVEDPASGRVINSKEKLEKLYTFTGFYMIVSK